MFIIYLIPESVQVSYLQSICPSCIQNATHVLKAAGGKLVVVLLDLVGGLREHQEPAFATGDLQASTVRTLIMLPHNIWHIK